MQLNNVAINDVVQCQVSEYALAVGKVIKVTPHRVYVEFKAPVVPHQLRDHGHRSRCIWYFGDGCQSKLSLIEPHRCIQTPISYDISDIDTHIINNLRQLADKQNSKEANKMLNKETLQDQLKQITQTIEGTEAALKGMRSYKALLEAGVKNYETMESVAIMPATLAKGLMDWANIWGGGK